MSNAFFGCRGSVALSCVVAASVTGCGGAGDALPPAVTHKAVDEARAKPLAAQAAPEPPKLESMRGVVPPDPRGTEGGRSVALIDYVQDRAAAVRLGKALFWDMNVGSDGSTACASCHFQAGVDNRITNQINPGLANSNPNSPMARRFDKPALAKSWGPNYTLALNDFPLHVLSDPRNRNSEIVSTTDDVISSQGVFDATFVRPGQSRFDHCTLKPDNIFHVGGINTRRVVSRNTPSMINAALNVRNFWDGRANNVFNGSTPFGNRDPDAGIWVTTGPNGIASKVRLALVDASAASQAVGPPMSDFEMACGGRSFANLARRILDMPSLNRQVIDPTDSVLSAFSGAKKPKYRDLIQAAFQQRLWNGEQPVSVGGAPFSQMEANFSLFFGLAIQMYESTLLSDQAPLDLFLDGNKNAMGEAEIRGMQVFTGNGRCIGCHSGPALSNATIRSRFAATPPVNRMLMGDGQAAIYDHGFYNIGVRPSTEDLGVGANDPWGHPLSFTRQYRTVLQNGAAPDPFKVDPCTFRLKVSSLTPCDPSAHPVADFRDAVDGAFKTPSLRNIALTGPYFHNGSRATLEQVLAFYGRGGEHRDTALGNTSGFGPNPSNVDPDFRPLALTLAERADLLAFLKNALTDPRVAWERAPFDHPSIVVPDGHIGDETRVPGHLSNDPLMGTRALDVNRHVKAVGKDGRAAKDGPLQPFHTNLK